MYKHSLDQSSDNGSGHGSGQSSGHGSGQSSGQISGHGSGHGSGQSSGHGSGHGSGQSSGHGSGYGSNNRSGQRSDHRIHEDMQIINNQLRFQNIKTESKVALFTPYPTSSNNEIDRPKVSNNIEFTPYNFTEEVSKINNNLNDEEEKEKNRRIIFDKNHTEKKKYLDGQIKKFENTYNSWEILGLEQDDLNINNIKKAYKKMALKYHPDRAGNKYQEKFQLITQSYIYLLGKAEEDIALETKLNTSVEDTEYDDNINEKVENIYINKDKFDINHFNKIFDDYKIPSSFDRGYSNLINEDIKEEKVFGQKFNNDIFNAHFDTVKKGKKKGSQIIEYQEPDALDSSTNNMNQTFLGVDNIEDFGSVCNNNLSYTDYKRAHIDETLLIDINKVKYKTYNSIDQLESDRSNISYTASTEDRKRQEYLDRKRLEDDNLRMTQQRNYDEMVKNQYNKINQRLIINK